MVMIGGAIGSALRYLVALALARLAGAGAGGWPWATLAVNVAGGLAMGLVMAWLGRGAGAGAADPARLLLAVGVLGGFTTFSAFAHDFWTLAARGLMGAALGYAGVSVLASLAAYWLGWTLMARAA